MKNKIYDICFIGNPNVGKSTIFNTLFSKQISKTGNWSGVTCENKYTSLISKNITLNIIDSPGIDSIYENSNEQKIALKNILNKKTDLFVHIIDGTNLEHDLYYSLLLKEYGVNFVMVINFADKMEKMKFSINYQKLEKIFGTKILEVTGFNKKQIGILPNWIISNIKSNIKKSKHFFYSNELNNYFYNVKRKIVKCSKFQKFISEKYTNINKEVINNYYTLGIIENKYSLMSNLLLSNIEFQDYLKKENTKLDSDEVNIKRDIFIKNTISSVVKNYGCTRKRFAISARIDKIILNRYFGMPIMLGILLFLFILIFNFTTPYKNFISDLFTLYIPQLLHLNINTWYGNLLSEGILNSLGILLSFLPVIYILFILISSFEQSGLMDRVRFKLEGLFNKIGLNGKSIVPFVLGLGCNVASIYATKTIKDKKIRKRTALLSPFMSCSARIVVFSLFANLFFGTNAGLIVFSLYLLGIFAVIIFGFIWTLFNKKEAKQIAYNASIIAPYNLPNWKVVYRSANINASGYVKRAASVILLFSIFIWTLNYFPIHNAIKNPDKSLLAQLRYVLQPIFTPLGFGLIWPLAVAIIPSIIAKETTVSALALLIIPTVSLHKQAHPSFSHDFLNTFIQSFSNLLPNHWFGGSGVFDISHDNALGNGIISFFKNQNINPKLYGLIGYSYMSFMLLTIPCVTTLGAIKHEFGWKTMLQSIFIGIATPYIVSLLIFQIGKLIILH